MTDTVRIITAEDLGRLQEIGELTALAYLADGLVGATDPYLPKLRDAAVRAADALLLALVDGQDGRGRVVGTITVVPPGSSLVETATGDEFELRMLAVSPIERGRGIGATLTRAALDMAVERGASRVVLGTLETMSAAHRIYERIGFARSPERDWFVVDNPDGTITQYPAGTATEEALVGTRVLGYVWEPGA